MTWLKDSNRRQKTNSLFLKKDLAGPVMEQRGERQGPALAHLGQVAEVEVKVLVLVILVE